MPVSNWPRGRTHTSHGTDERVKIGDLLASISGGPSGDGPSTKPAPTLVRANTMPKRKADEDIRSMASKTTRMTLSSTVTPRPTDPPRSRQETSTAPPRSNQPSRPVDRPTPSQRPANGITTKPSVLSSRPMNGTHRVTKPPAPSRPSPGPSNTSVPPRAAPKKGSFAEILARGQRAQAVMGQVGKIQHKKVEKGAAPKREKDELRADPRTPKKKQQSQSASSGYTGTGKSGQRSGTPVNGHGKDGRNGKSAPPLTKAEQVKAVAAQEEREKKMKKAAAATTGYTGTARPKPGNPAKKKGVVPGGALLNVRVPRPKSSKSRFDDDADEDMEDFIDYDDEEDEGGPRYDYASDESSDMEAGLDDIDTEERRAEIIARQEDIIEERLEKSLKAQKEYRKRKALEELRAGRRR
ncbi:hypothetical protein G7046_g73 [Stylonectria norvegica]|nr:hypothetical protein G7046_g73 [Stylonectria norvegica]